MKLRDTEVPPDLERVQRGDGWKASVFAASVPVAKEMVQAIVETQPEAVKTDHRVTCGGCHWWDQDKVHEDSGWCLAPLPFWHDERDAMRRCRVIGKGFKRHCDCWKKPEEP